ncbi:MAG: Holliday junction branch migration protein RuvA [Myxococcota bacterium]
MIAWLEGVLRELAPTRVVVDVGGVGYELHVPLSTFTELPNEGKSIALYVHTHAREGAIQLFGFHTSAEREAFELLLRASRVGPKLAQTILSGISPAELLDAIRGGNLNLLRATPGIGTKTAERILVELRDRTHDLAAAISPEAAGPTSDETDSTARIRDQTLSALLNLGYPKSHAERALVGAQEEAGPQADLEALVRVSLRRLAR